MDIVRPEAGEEQHRENQGYAADKQQELVAALSLCSIGFGTHRFLPSPRYSGKTHMSRRLFSFRAALAQIITMASVRSSGGDVKKVEKSLRNGQIGLAAVAKAPVGSEAIIWAYDSYSISRRYPCHRPGD